MNSLIPTAGIIAATFLGPLFAVLATRYIDARRDKNKRRYDIFIALMTTRRINLSKEHVDAINRIEIEFSEDEKVIRSLQAYMDVLSDFIPKENEAFKVWDRRKNRTFATLVQNIGSSIGRQVDRNDLIDGGYYPKGLVDREELQLEVMSSLKEVLQQSRPILVSKASFRPSTLSTNPDSKYPDPPN